MQHRRPRRPLLCRRPERVQRRRAGQQRQQLCQRARLHVRLGRRDVVEAEVHERADGRFAQAEIGARRRDHGEQVWRIAVEQQLAVGICSN